MLQKITINVPTILHKFDKYLIDKTNSQDHIEKLSDQIYEFILCIHLSIYISNRVYNTQNYTIF